MTIVCAAGWEELVDRLHGLKGAALFLGRSDSGKTTLVRYLLGALASTERPVTLVDADVGQSSLGLPGSVSRRTFHLPPDIAPLHFEHLSFLGCVTPVPVLSLLAAETGRMVLAGRSAAPLTLIDTTGLVDGPLGKALKLAKIRAVKPEVVVAVSAGTELEHILAAIPQVETIRLRPALEAQRRTPRQRIGYRYARLADHLRHAREIMLPTRRLLFLHRGMPVHVAFAPPEVGTVVGLNHQGETRALGVVVEAEAGSLTVLTPLATPRGIDRVVIGDFNYPALQHRATSPNSPSPFGLSPTVGLRPAGGRGSG